MVKILDELHIGTGRDRICYLSPEDPNICIKISKASNKQSRREVSYYKFLMSRNIDMSHIAKYYGPAVTDRGKGECFEVIRNYDNKVSLTLRECIKSKELEKEEILTLLESLKLYLIDNMIVTRDLSPANIMVQKSAGDQIELKIIDGLGNPNINPLTVRVKSLASKAVIKSFGSLLKKTLREIQQASSDLPK